MTRIGMALLIATSVSAAVSAMAEMRGWRRVLYVFKPLTMLFVIASFVSGRPDGPIAWVWVFVAVGLVASLAGDVLLMLESDHFVSGLASFLVAHCFYILAFATRVLEVPGFAADLGFWLPIAVLLLYAVFTFRYLEPSLGPVKIPVAVYVGVITMMGWFAAAGYAMVGDQASSEALTGAVLFMASDTLLAMHRFRSRLPAGPLWIFSTYVAAQWLIAASANH